MRLIVLYAKYIEIAMIDANKFNERMVSVIFDNTITADTKSNDKDKCVAGFLSRLLDR